MAKNYKIVNAFFSSVLLFVSLTFQLSAQSAQTSYDALRKISLADLRSDFLLLRAALEEVHPSLYLYTSKPLMDRAFDDTFQSLNKPLTETEFINLLSLLLCQIRCGHTQLSHSHLYKQASNRPKIIQLPFDVFVQNTRCYIIENKSTEASLTPGLELIEINGITCSTIIESGLNW